MTPLELVTSLRRTKWTFTLSWLVLVACTGAPGVDGAEGQSTSDGGSSVTGANDGSTAGETGSSGKDKAGVDWAAIHRASEAVSLRADQAAALAVDAVRVATALSGLSQPVTTGTVQVQGAQAKYEPQPSDKLVIRAANGQVLEFVFRGVSGPIDNPSGFVERPHSLEVQLKVPGQGEVELASTAAFVRQYTMQRTTRIKGVLMEKDKSYRVDLTRDGTLYSDTDSTGGERESKYTLQGEIESEPEQLKMQVNEQVEFTFVDASSSNHQSSYDKRDINSALTVKGDRYVIAATMNKAFRNGKIHAPDSWVCRGDLTRNGQPFGRYVKDGISLQDRGGGAIFYLELPGERVELSRWTDFVDPNSGKGGG